ncbi:unnamed protein product [Closterium sp. NIES-53]
MELRLKETLNGIVLKVQLGEMAGGVEERVAALEAKLRDQGDAMAALKRDMADIRSSMALLKGMAATGALAEGERDGSASGKAAAEASGAQPLKGAREFKIAAIEAEEVKAQVEAARGEARDAASEAAEVAYVKATAAHSEARINDVELALAALRAEAGEHAEAERRDGKKRKRDEACEEEEMADAPSGAVPALIAIGRAPEGQRDAAERMGDANEGESGVAGDPEDELKELRARVEALEKTSAGGRKTWSALIGLWAKVHSGRSRIDLSSVSLLTDVALTQLASVRSLTWLNLNGATGFTAAGVRQLFSLTNLVLLNLIATNTADAALEGISGLNSLHTLNLGNNGITDVGIQKLQGMTQLTALDVSECSSVTSASMVHVGELTALTSLRLNDTGVTEDGLQHLTALTALKALTLPPGVTDSGMKLLRNMKCLKKLGLWDANLTVAGVQWLNAKLNMLNASSGTASLEIL